MALAAHRVGKRDAAERVADICIALARARGTGAARDSA
jgi:UDP-N-acetylglucosamine:LPS N-acetylglucosamine transferase